MGCLHCGSHFLNVLELIGFKRAQNEVVHRVMNVRLGWFEYWEVGCTYEGGSSFDWPVLLFALLLFGWSLRGRKWSNCQVRGIRTTVTEPVCRNTVEVFAGLLLAVTFPFFLGGLFYLPGCFGSLIVVIDHIPPWTVCSYALLLLDLRYVLQLVPPLLHQDLVLPFLRCVFARLRNFNDFFQRS